MSKTTDFDAFVQRQQELKKQQEAFNPQKELQKWRDDLAALYSRVETYLKRYTDIGAAQIAYRDITLNEDFAGNYVVPQMNLTIGRSTVAFVPIGTMLIGSRGRVDVQGPLGKARLVLIGKNVTSARQMIHVTVSETPPVPQPREPVAIEWTWKISTSPPDMRFIDLTEETFYEMILAVANG